MGIRPNSDGVIPPAQPDNPETRYSDWLTDFEDSGEIVGGVWQETDAKASSGNDGVTDLAGRVAALEAVIDQQVGIETTARLKTVATTTNGWNDLMLDSGLGTAYQPSYFRLPAGTYRISYMGRTEPFERYTQSTDRGTLTPVNGLVTEIVRFEASDFFRIPGNMTDLSILFEFLF